MISVFIFRSVYLTEELNTGGIKFQVKDKYKLGNLKTFHYLNQSNCYELDGVDDTKEYFATRRAMDVVGITEEEQASHLCQISELC